MRSYLAYLALGLVIVAVAVGSAVGMSMAGTKTKTVTKVVTKTKTRTRTVKQKFTTPLSLAKFLDASGRAVVCPKGVPADATCGVFANNRVYVFLALAPQRGMAR